MAKYTRLTTHLRASGRAEIRMTFADIEVVIRAKLPDSARRHRAWWSNNPSSSVATKAWLSAGYESAQVRMNKEELLFRRVAPVSPSPGVGVGPQTPNPGAGPVGGVSGRASAQAAPQAHVAPQIAAVNARIDDVHRDMRDFRDDVLARLNDFDTRLRAVEVSFGRVDQRILTLERLVLPAPLGAPAPVEVATAGNSPSSSEARPGPVAGSQ